MEVMQNPMMLAEWPDRTAYDIYKMAIRTALAQRDARTRARMLADATAAWDRSLIEDDRMAA
jgi:tRNA A37 threonylcarbamoyladenosine biosynthesis protein TsaE